MSSEAAAISAQVPISIEKARGANLGIHFSSLRRSQRTIAAAVSLNEATDALNGTIEATAATDGATFVDVSRTFAGHGVPSATGGQWINYNAADSTYFGNFHPNALGQQGYAAALAAAVPAL